MRWLSPAENAPQPDIGAVCPFSGKTAEKVEGKRLLFAENSLITQKVTYILIKSRMKAVYSELP